MSCAAQMVLTLFLGSTFRHINNLWASQPSESAFNAGQSQLTGHLAADVMALDGKTG